jgi:hypothetical protein
MQSKKARRGRHAAGGMRSRQQISQGLIGRASAVLLGGLVPLQAMSHNTCQVWGGVPWRKHMTSSLVSCVGCAFRDYGALAIGAINQTTHSHVCSEGSRTAAPVKFLDKIQILKIHHEDPPCIVRANIESFSNSPIVYIG